MMTRLDAFWILLALLITTQLVWYFTKWGE